MRPTLCSEIGGRLFLLITDTHRAGDRRVCPAPSVQSPIGWRQHRSSTNDRPTGGHDGCDTGRVSLSTDCIHSWTVDSRTNGRTYGRTDGRTDGRRTDGTDGWDGRMGRTDRQRANRRKDGRTVIRTDGRTERRTGGRTDGLTDGRSTNGRTDGRTNRHTSGRTVDGRTGGWMDATQALLVPSFVERATAMLPHAPRSSSAGRPMPHCAKARRRYATHAQRGTRLTLILFTRTAFNNRAESNLTFNGNPLLVFRDIIVSYIHTAPGSIQ